MSLYALGFREYDFPDPSLALEGGLLAVGGDLSPECLEKAYSLGIFPWFSVDSPILWWSPDPRCVLFPAELRVPRSLERIIRKDIFSVSFDEDFPAVVRSCAEKRDQKGTWLVPEMIDAYIELHNRGLAHSVEVRQAGRLVGGLYGLAFGRIFFGESMFYRVSNASKVGLVALVRALLAAGFQLIDCQQTTGHMLRFGAREISREFFRCLLDRACGVGVNRGTWSRGIR